jgi:hypothetical protein
VPDEQSNLNSPRRASGNRRRGRRGGRGRGRGARPATPETPETEAPAAEQTALPPETVDTTAVAPDESAPHVENEVESTGGFREPHPETPEGFSSHEVPSHAEMQEPEPVTEVPAAEPERTPAPEPPREQHREERRPHRREDRREERREERPTPVPPPPRVAPAQRQWAKPSDFRPAAPTAISQAVEHAMFIATALKELHDQMDEILELVEVAERQKLADEREIEELRRALRRIQPQRQQSQSHHQPHHQQQRHQPRREEPRHNQPHREQSEKHEESPRPSEAHEPTEPPHRD